MNKYDATDKLSIALQEWGDPLGARTMSDAEELIDLLRIELAGKESVINVLRDDIREYRLAVKEQNRLLDA